MQRGFFPDFSQIHDIVHVLWQSKEVVLFYLLGRSAAVVNHITL